MSEKIKIILFMLIFLSSSLYSAGYQTQLNNGMWQAVGIQGAYSADGVAVGYDADPSFEFYDIADDNTTWVTINSSDSSQLIYNNPAGQSIEYGITTQLRSTIGLFAIKGQRSKKIAGFTTLDGSNGNVVKLKITNPLAYRNDIPMYRMYVEGQTGVATFRIDFQADYQGVAFKIRFGTEDESYISYFNYSNTFDSPATIKLDIGGEDSLGSKTPIVDAIDFNLTDNNVTALLTTTLFRIKDATGAYAPTFRVYSADSGNRIEVYSMVGNSTWTRFDTANSLASSNTITEFVAGRGYWVRATSQQSHDDDNITRIGIITSDTSLISDKNIYGSLGNGWHMLTFEESDLRYAPTGMFIPIDTVDSTGTGMYMNFGRHSSTEYDNNSSRNTDLNLSRTVLAATGGTAVLARHINLAAKASNLLFGTDVNMRAFPATDINETNGSVNGVIVIADSLFEVNSSDVSVTTLAGATLKSTSRGFYSSRYGEFMLATKLTDINGSDVNASVSFAMPKYSATAIVASDLNDTNASARLRKMKDALSLAATLAGATTPATLSTGYHINLDFNGTISYGPLPTALYANLDDYPHVLFAAGARFSIADATYTRLYKFEQNGRLKVIGPIGSQEVLPTSLDTNITYTIRAINAVTDETGVVAIDLGSDYFMINSGGGSVSLEEDYNATLFTDIPLGSSLIPEESRDLTRGAISEVYSHRDILARTLFAKLGYMDDNGSSSIVGIDPTDNNLTWDNIYRYILINDINGTPDSTVNAPKLTQDLRQNAIWALDFPINLSLIQKFAGYNKEITNISVQQFSHDNISYYDFLDLTKDPDDWYGNTYNTDSDLKFDNDYQGIFKIYKNTNYWVKIKDKTPLSGTIDDSSSIVYTAKPAFNNKVSGGVGVTQNHIKHTLNIKFNQGFIDPLARDYYNVVAIIGGIKYYLRDNGVYFTLSVNDLDMNLASKSMGQADDAIFINAYDGEGNIFKEEGTTSSKFSIYFRKPPTPVLTFEANGSLGVTNRGNYIVEKYTSYISDISSKRATSEVADLNDTKFGWKSSGAEATYGRVVSLRVVLKDPKYNLYSDIKSILYAPLYEGHVLKITSANEVVRVPYSYSQKQMLTYQEAGTTIFKPYDKTNGVDNGVQLSMQEGAGNRDVYFSYLPEGAESQRQITQFGGTRTMYLSLEEDTSTNSNPIASVTYLPAYEGKIFYVYFNNNLYQGRFQANDTYNNDSSTYNLSTGTLSVDNLLNNSGTAQTLATGTSGFKIDSGSVSPQAIIIPTPVPTPTPAVDNNGTGP